MMDFMGLMKQAQQMQEDMQKLWDEEAAKLAEIASTVVYMPVTSGTDFGKSRRTTEGNRTLAAAIDNPAATVPTRRPGNPRNPRSAIAIARTKRTSIMARSTPNRDTNQGLKKAPRPKHRTGAAVNTLASVGESASESVISASRGPITATAGLRTREIAIRARSPRTLVRRFT